MRVLKQILLVFASVVGLGGAAAAMPTEADVAVVRDYVGKNRAYTPAARAEAMAAVERLPALLNAPARFELEAAHIAALADNGHSALLPPQWATRYPRSPVHLGLFADGLYVIAAPAPHAALLRRRVTQINGQPWQSVRTAYARYQGGAQAFRDQFVTLFMETPALLAAAGFGNPDQLQLTVESRRGRPLTVSIDPLLSAPEGEAAFLGVPTLIDAAPMLTSRPLYLQEPGRPFRLAFPRGIEGAYIQLNAIRGLHFDAFLHETLQALRTRRTRNIVVDLRFNLGGDLNLARDFMAALPGVATGQIYAITSGRTFSAAISSLGYLKQAAGDRLTIVGEPIGDRLEFWAEGDILMLPGLGAMMLYADERHNYRTGCPEEDCHGSIRDHPIRVAGLQPDLPVPMTFAAFAAGRDPAMDAIARDVARRRPRLAYESMLR
ncbi:MAG TPA: hypothetical protein VLK25_09095 [Allosphingosinicella sp.]|nr:hypothetical protein [Allosphingosinicella sp.]